MAADCWPRTSDSTGREHKTPCPAAAPESSPRPASPASHPLQSVWRRLREPAAVQRVAEPTDPASRQSVAADPSSATTTPPAPQPVPRPQPRAQESTNLALPKPPTVAV